MRILFSVSVLVGLLVSACASKERPDEEISTDSLQSAGFDSVKIEVKSSGHKLVDYYNTLLVSISQDVESDGGGGEHTSFGYSLHQLKDYKLLKWEEKVVDQSFDETAYLYQNDSLLAVYSHKKAEYSSAYVESLVEFKSGKVTTVERSIEGANVNFYEINLDSLALESIPFQERIEPGYSSKNYLNFTEQLLHFKNLVKERNLAIQEQNAYDSVSYE